MVKYRNKFRLSYVAFKIRNNIVTFFKGDVPSYIANDILNRLSNGEEEVTLTMCGDVQHKSLVDYLNEYHRCKNKGWRLEFLHTAFMFTSERINQKVGKFNDIDVSILELSDTDKRITIKLK